MAKEKSNEAQKTLIYTVEAKGFTGVNVREKPDENSMVLYVAFNGSMVKPDNGKKAPAGWIAVQGGGFMQKKYLI